MSEPHSFIVPLRSGNERAFPAAGAGAPVATVVSVAALQRQLLNDFAQHGIGERAPLPIGDFLARAKASQFAYDPDTLSRVCVEASAGGPTVTGGAVAAGYAARVRELHNSVATLERDVDRLNSLVRHVDAQLRKAEAAERARPPGVAESNVLTVQILAFKAAAPAGGGPAAGGVDFDDSDAAAGGAFYRLAAACADQTVATDWQAPGVSGAGAGTKEVFWNTMVSFSGHSRNDELRLRLERRDHLAEYEMGGCSLPLDEMLDQRKHEWTREVWASSGGGPDSGPVGELTVAAQWIYCERLLYESFSREFVARRDLLNTDLRNAQAELHRLVNPLGLARGRQGGLRGLLVAVGPDALAASVDRVLDHLKLSSESKVMVAVCAGVVFIAAVQSMNRAAYWDQLFGLYGLWACLDPNRRTTAKRVFLNLIFAAVIGLVLDVLWLRAFFAESNENGLLKTEGELRSVATIFALLGFFWKVVAIIFFWKCYYDRKRFDQQRQAPSNAKLIRNAVNNSV